MLGKIALLTATLAAAVPVARGQAPQAADLPSVLEGKWVFTSPSARRLEGRIALTVDGPVGPDAGTGRLTWEGINCKGVDLPATVRYDGRELVIAAKFDDGDVCGVQTVKLARTDRSGMKSLFEGTVTATGKRMSGSTAQAFLDPK
jgi:hypothetical protein